MDGIHPYDSIDLDWERRSDAATEALIGIFIRYPNAFSKLEMNESAIVRNFLEALDRRERCKNVRITELNLRLMDTYIERDDIRFLWELLCLEPLQSLTRLRLKANRWENGTLKDVADALGDGKCPLLSEVELCSDDQWFEGEIASDRELYNILGKLASDLRSGCSPIRRLVLKSWGWDGVVKGTARAKLRKLLSSHACRELETLEIQAGSTDGTIVMAKQVSGWLNKYRTAPSLETFRLTGPDKPYTIRTGHTNDNIMAALCRESGVVPNLKTLSLTNVPLDLGGIEVLSEAIEKGEFPLIHTLVLNNVGRNGAAKLKRLTKAFENNREASAAITSLGVSYNEAPDEGSGREAVMAAIEQGVFPNLRTFCVDPW
jgi:hypothetical protein